MGLTKRTESGAIFLQAKHNCLWQEFKAPIEGQTIAIQVTNPRTHEVITKHGIAHATLEGYAESLEYYNRTDPKSNTKFVGWKLKIRDGGDIFILDIPYKTKMFRVFSMAAPNIDWHKALSITVFKGRNKKGGEEMAVWLRQSALTIKPYYTKDHPNGLPQAKHDSLSNEWDFKEQERYLAVELRDVVSAKIKDAAENDTAEPLTPNQDNGDTPDGSEPPPVDFGGITDDDIPF